MSKSADIPAIISAPFTTEQVKALNEHQLGGWMHPFTCCSAVNNDSCRDRLGCQNDERLLVATNDGWICPTCDYIQDWAFGAMTTGPPDWYRNLVRMTPDV